MVARRITHGRDSDSGIFGGFHIRRIK